MKRQTLFGLLFLFTIVGFGQNFEGSITYKTEVENPYPGLLSDSMWQETVKQKLGEKGYMVQKYFYKNDNYISEIEIGEANGLQAYNPEDGLLYSWQEKSDTAITVDSKKSLDKFIEVVHTEETDTILGIPCKSIIIKSTTGETKMWYNSEYLKMDAKLYEGHVYGHWEQTLKAIGCIPLKMKTATMTITIMEFKEMTIDATKFKLPEFSKIIENPVN